MLGAILIVEILGQGCVGLTSLIKNEFIGSMLNLVILVLLSGLAVGLVKFMISVKNGQKSDITTIFSYYNKDFKNIATVNVLEILYVLLYTLLLIVPGIIKAFSYALVDYILAEDPTRPSEEVLKLSENMMNGHKMDFFILDLSFIGWHLLAILTLGILEIWIVPYQQLARTKFLCDIKDNYEKEHKQASTTETPVAA